VRPAWSVESIAISLHTYIAAHSDPVEFMVVPVHLDPSAEDVVASGSTYVVARPKRDD